MQSYVQDNLDTSFDFASLFFNSRFYSLILRNQPKLCFNTNERVVKSMNMKVWRELEF